MASLCCRQSGYPRARLSLSSNRLCALVILACLPLCIHSLSSASFLGHVHQEREFFCHWVALAEAFESHLMFARLQGSPRRSCLMSHVMSEQRWRRQEEGGWWMKPARNVWKLLTSASMPLIARSQGSESEAWNACLSYILLDPSWMLAGGCSYVW